LAAQQHRQLLLLLGVLLRVLLLLPVHLVALVLPAGDERPLMISPGLAPLS
jgi:hypothetical protein